MRDDPGDDAKEVGQRMPANNADNGFVDRFSDTYRPNFCFRHCNSASTFFDFPWDGFDLSL